MSGSRDEDAPTRALRGRASPVIVAALSLAVGLGVAVTLNPFLGIALALGLLLAAAFVVEADLAMAAALFALYSNAAVVAIRFHGVPSAAAALVPLCFALPILRNVLVRREKLVLHPVLPLLGLYFAVQSVSAVFSRDFEVSKASLIELFSEGIVLFALVTNAVRTPEALRRATWAVLLAGLFMGLVVSLQQATGMFDRDFGGFAQITDVGFRTGEVTSRGEVRQFQHCGSIGEQNRFSQVMLMVLPLGFLRSRDERRLGLRLLAVMATAFSAAGFALAFSRGGAVALAVVIIAMVCLGIVKGRQLFTVAAVLALFLLVVFPQYLIRLSTIASIPLLFFSDSASAVEPDGALKGRATEMLAAVLVVADHPVVGVGPGMFPEYSREYGNPLGIHRLKEAREAHSLYLGVAAEHGLLGLGCFLAILAVTLRDLLRARRRWLEERPELASLATGYLLTLIAFAASAAFLHMAFLRYFYVVLGLAAAAGRIASTKEAAPDHELRRHDAADC